MSYPTSQDQGCSMRARIDLGYGKGGHCVIRNQPCPLPCLLKQITYYESESASLQQVKLTKATRSDNCVHCGELISEKDSVLVHTVSGWMNCATPSTQSIKSEPNKTITIIYTNWRGETSRRAIQPISIKFESSLWHTQEQWLLKVLDIEKNEMRLFALKDIHLFVTNTKKQIEKVNTQWSEKANKILLDVEISKLKKAIKDVLNTYSHDNCGEYATNPEPNHCTLCALASVFRTMP